MAFFSLLIGLISLELRIGLKDGHTVGLLAGRRDEELEWIAALLREALRLPPPPARSRV